MKAFVGILRILGIVILLLLGLISLFLVSPFRNRSLANSLFLFFKKLLLKVLGVKVHGPKWENLKPGLVMANHRSYLDVLFIPTDRPITFVAKREVRSWPLIGQAAQGLGTIWVKRENKKSRMLTRERILRAIDKGKNVVVFPEGTSWEGPQMLPLKPAMFYESAVRSIPIYQWSVHFDNAKTAFPIGVGFVKHLWSVVTVGTINAYVDLRKEPLLNKDGDALLLEATSWWKTSLRKLYNRVETRDENYWPDERLHSGEFQRF